MSKFTADNINLNSIKDILASIMNRWDSILNSTDSITATELSKYDNELAEIKSLLLDINNLELYSDISVATAKINELQTLLNTIEESITSKFETVDSQILSKFQDTDSLISQNIDLFNQEKTVKFEELEIDFSNNLVTLNQAFTLEKNTLFGELNTLIQDIQNKLDNGFFKGGKGDKGDKGDPLTFQDLTPEQIESLKVINPNDYFTKEDITTLLANKADTTLLSQKADVDTLNQVLATLQSSDLNLDTLQEIVNFITVNRDTLNNLSLDNIACGTLYKKVSVELYTKLLSLRTNQEIDLLLADKASSTGSIEKTFKVANAQLPQEAVNLQQIQSMLSSLSIDFASIQNVPNFGSNPVGTIITFATTSIPDGYLYCNGQVVSRTTYADLFNAIGTTFGSGNGSTTFQLPDLRGYFVRGFDDSRGIDSGRTFGSVQADDFKSHTHSFNYNNSSVPGDYGNGSGFLTSKSVGLSRISDPGTEGRIGSFNSFVGGFETRPKNISLVYAIKY